MQNIVVYEAKVTAEGKVNESDPMDAYWYDIDPEYTKKRRAKGDMTDRVELGMVERRMAYGCVSVCCRTLHIARCTLLLRAFAVPGTGTHCGVLFLTSHIRRSCTVSL